MSIFLIAQVHNFWNNRKTFFDFLLFSVDGGIKKQILGQEDQNFYSFTDSFASIQI